MAPKTNPPFGGGYGVLLLYFFYFQIPREFNSSPLKKLSFQIGM